MEEVIPDSVVAIVSGGLDSSTMLWVMATKGIQVKEVISFNYGQRHQKELDHAQMVVSKFEETFYAIDYKQVDISTINSLIAKGSLTGSDMVPKEMYDSKNQRITIVPNRNMILISIAAGRAVTIKASHVAYAAHASDYEVYPDCRPEFINHLDQALYLGNIWNPVRLYAPFQNKTKRDVVKLGLKLHAPLELTWSCYEGAKRPCLECGTCLERTESFLQNKINDPLLLEREWHKAVSYLKKHKNKT